MTVGSACSKNAVRRYPYEDVSIDQMVSVPITKRRGNAL